MARDFPKIQPLGTSRRLSLVANSALAPLPRGAVRVAEIDNSGRWSHSDDYGWLVQLANGRFIIQQVGGAVRNVDQRAAAAAVAKANTPYSMDIERATELTDDAIPSDPAATATELAHAIKAWRGNLPISRAAQLLGIPQRTLEGVEQGRGFRYPRLMHLALLAFGDEH